MAIFKITYSLCPPIQEIQVYPKSNYVKYDQIIRIALTSTTTKKYIIKRVNFTGGPQTYPKFSFRSQ
jgi:hypothetical protein